MLRLLDPRSQEGRMSDGNALGRLAFNKVQTASLGVAWWVDVSSPPPPTRKHEVWSAECLEQRGSHVEKNSPHPARPRGQIPLFWHTHPSRYKIRAPSADSLARKQERELRNPVSGKRYKMGFELGTCVETTLGTGVLVEFRPADGVHVVRLWKSRGKC